VPDFSLHPLNEFLLVYLSQSQADQTDICRIEECPNRILVVPPKRFRQILNNKDLELGERTVFRYEAVELPNKTLTGHRYSYYASQNRFRTRDSRRLQ